MFCYCYIFGHHFHLNDGTGEIAVIIVEHRLKGPFAINEIPAVVSGGNVLDVYEEMVVTLKNYQQAVKIVVARVSFVQHSLLCCDVSGILYRADRDIFVDSRGLL